MAKVEHLFLLILLSGLTGKEAKPAKYESVCSDFLVQFGDSLSDTGNAVVAFPMLAFQGRSPPYGSAFPGFPTGRYSNGRLIIDWLAGAFKLQTLEPYLRSLVPNIMLNSSSAVADTGNYRGGVCFSVALSTAESVVELKRSGTNTAIGKSTVLNPFTVDVQYQWFRSFKDLVSASSSSTGGLLPNLPNPKVFPEALYVIGEIGVNDYLLKFITGQNFSQVKAAVTAVVQITVNLIEKLYIREGARKFLVIGLTPQGCSPSFLTFFSGPKNKFNCLAHYNEIDQLHESEMRNSVHKLRKKLHDSIIIYADYYGAYLSVLNNAAQYGIKVTDRACCGGGGPHNFNLTAPCGTPSAKACPNPQNYIYWDDTFIYMKCKGGTYTKEGALAYKSCTFFLQGTHYAYISSWLGSTRISAHCTNLTSSTPYSYISSWLAFTRIYAHCTNLQSILLFMHGNNSYGNYHKVSMYIL